MGRANDTQIGGGHYQSDYQHWDWMTKVIQNRYMEGIITSYVLRWRKKNGVQDLEKAVHCIDKLIELFEEGVVAPLGYETRRVVETQKFCNANDVQGWERSLMFNIATWGCRQHLENAKEDVLRLITEVAKN